MKKFQFMSLVALMLLMSSSVMAQNESKSEISFSVGGGTPNEKNIGEALGEGFAKALGKGVATIFTFGQVDLTDKTQKDASYGPVFNLQYLYSLTSKVKVGAALSYQRTSNKLLVADNSGNFREVAKANNDYFTVMPVVKAVWAGNKNIGFYSKVAAGVCIASNSAKMVGNAKENTPGELTDQIKSDKGTRFGYQVSALGFEAGTRNLRGFVELGYGFQGFAQVGANFKF